MRDYEICNSDCLELSNRKVVARKAHPCNHYNCNQPIRKGQCHIKVAFIDDNGKFQCERYHLSHFSGEDE